MNIKVNKKLYNLYKNLEILELLKLTKSITKQCVCVKNDIQLVR